MHGERLDEDADGEAIGIGNGNMDGVGGADRETNDHSDDSEHH